MKLAVFWFLFVFLLASCQVKEKSPDGGLLSGHLPTTNAFSIATPTSATYITGNTLSITLTFPFVVTVTGTPQLALTIGVTPRTANYASGTGSKNLVFSYTIIAADNDTDGVTVNSLGLNGGTMVFDLNGVTTNCDVSTVSATSFSNVLVDNTGPTVSGLSISTIPGFYHVGDSLGFTMTFSEAVIVTGTPRIAVAFTTGGSVYFNYSGGTGTTTLAFTYTITNSVADINGYNSITSPMDLNGGTIKDSSGNDTSLVIAAYTAAAITASSTRLFDGRIPYIQTFTPPANGTYEASDNIDLTYQFDRAVNVTGSPYISLTIGSTTRQAVYTSGTGTTTLVFRYTTIPGETDADGITIPGTITQNGGDIVGVAVPANSFFLQPLNNVYSVGTTTGILVASIQPQATAISRNTDTTLPTWGAATADNKWIIGQQLIFTVTFNAGITVDLTGGTPRIPITVGVTTRYATYLSGGNGQTNLNFTYTIVEGDLDTDTNIGIADLELNGGSMVDALNTNILTTMPVASVGTTSIDGVRPTISSITAPANGTYSTVTGNNHLNMTFTVNWSEAVNYSATTAAAAYIPMTIGATGVNAVYASGNQTAAVIHRAASLATLNDSDGIVLTSPFAGTATFKDLAGNSANVLTFSSPVTTSIFVDTTIPTIASVTKPADATYSLGQNIDFTVTFSESVTTNVTGGYPRVAVDIGGTTRYAVPTASATAVSHVFRYTVVASEQDLNGILYSSPVVNSGGSTIRDLGLNDVTPLTFVSPTTTSVFVDALAPTISSVTAPSASTYQSGDNVDFSIVFSETVTVTGTPRIQTTAQTGTIDFDYVSGTGSTTLVFRRTLATSDFDLDGLTAVSAIALNGGTISDGTNSAVLSFTSEPLTGVYFIYPNCEVWATSNLSNNAPAAAGITLTSTGASTTAACGSGTCRVFDGDDSMSTSNAVNGVKDLYLVFQAPASVAGNETIISPDVALDANGGVFDMDSANATSFNYNGSTSSGTDHNTNLATSSSNVIEIVYSATENYSVGVIIPTAFTGAIGEVLMFTGPLSVGQRTEVRTYLNAKY